MDARKRRVLFGFIIIVSGLALVDSIVSGDPLLAVGWGVVVVLAILEFRDPGVFGRWRTRLFGRSGSAGDERAER